MTIDDFMARVEFDAIAGCWLWPGHHTVDGYGTCQHRKKTLLAHRVSWELSFGVDPVGKLVCHKCDVPACVNPDHLFLGTQADNMADMRLKGRASRKFGQANGRARLTDAQAAEILRLVDNGLADRKLIAEQYGISSSTIHRLIRGESFPAARQQSAIKEAAE